MKNYFPVNYTDNAILLNEKQFLEVMATKPRAQVSQFLNWAIRERVETPSGIYRNAASPCFTFNYWENPNGEVFDFSACA
jgi:hypothetical protein